MRIGEIVAHLWAKNNRSWDFMPVTRGSVELSACGHEAALAKGVFIRQSRKLDTGETWVLMIDEKCNGHVAINGTPVNAGLRVLSDRDEIRVGAIRAFFSTERLARVENFEKEPGKPAVFCPRCKQEITDGPAVRCPQCGLWHHQSEELPCWTYGEHCAMCDQETELERGYRWTPWGL